MTPISWIAVGPQGLVAHPAVPAKTAGGINYAHAKNAVQIELWLVGQRQRATSRGRAVQSHRAKRSGRYCSRTRYHFQQAMRLLLHRLGCHAGCFYHLRVLLRRLLQMDNGLIHLLNTIALLLRDCCNLRNDSCSRVLPNRRFRAWSAPRRPPVCRHYRPWPQSRRSSRCARWVVP